MSAAHGIGVGPYPETEAMPAVGSTTVGHWTYNVGTPFRSPREIGELAGQSASAYGALAEELLDPPTELETPFRDLVDLAELEYEAFEDEDSEAEAGEEGYVEGAHLMEETPPTDHPLAALFALPRMAFDAMARGGWATAIAVAIGAGIRDVAKLTNMVFWFRHPEQTGQKIRRDQRDLAREWLEIRDQIVKPALAAGASTGGQPDSPAPVSSTSSPLGPPSSASGRGSPIPSDDLQWPGASDEQRRFMRAVYDAHVAWSKGRGNRFVPDLPDGQLNWVDRGRRHRMRTDAAEAARSMLEAAEVQLAKDGLTGQIRLGIRSAYRTAAEQFRIWQGLGTGGGFPAYYRETSDMRPKNDPHGPEAVQILMKHMRKKVAAPGFSNHQHGTAIDLATRKGPGDLVKLYPGSWFHNWLWLKKNAATYNFHPLEGEEWHWFYVPPKGAATGALSNGESWTDPHAEASTVGEVTPTSIPAGRANVDKVPALASHRGRGPDLVLRWNDMPAVPKEVDVVVHLHGYSRANLTLPRDIEVWSGLDLAPVDGAAGKGRTRPTLTVLPRGHFTGIPARNIYRYTFPALTTRDGLTALVQAAIKEFSNRVGGQPPMAGRLILTAHSGGGAPLMRILRSHDPDEVHVFDGLYQDAATLADWATRHIQADRAAAGAGRPPTGSMRVFFRPGTRAFSTRLQKGIGPALDGAPAAIADRYRVEASTLGHWQIPRQYGWRILADPSADVPDARRPMPAGIAARPRYEFEEGESPFLPETLDEESMEGESPFVAEALEDELTEDESPFHPEALEYELTEAESPFLPETPNELANRGPGSSTTEWELDAGAFEAGSEGGAGDSEDETTSEARLGQGEEGPEFEELGADAVLAETFADAVGSPEVTESPVGQESFGPFELQDVGSETPSVVGGLETFEGIALPSTAAEVSMSLRPPDPAAERCKQAWFAKIRKLNAPIREALDIEYQLSWVDAFERVQRAIDLGERDANLLTNFAYFAMDAFSVGYCPIKRGDVNGARNWATVQREVLARLAGMKPPVGQVGPIACVGPRENRPAAPQAEGAPSGLTGRYEYTVASQALPTGAMAVNQAGRHLEVSLSPFVYPGSGLAAREVRFYEGDLDPSGVYIAINRENHDKRFVLRPLSGGVLALAHSNASAAFATARRVDARATMFPEALVSISESRDPGSLQRGPIAHLVEAARRSVTTQQLAPFLLQQEHQPLAEHQVRFLRERFQSNEWMELLRAAVAVTGHRSAEAAGRERLVGRLETFVRDVVHNRLHGVDSSDHRLARALVRRTLTETVIEYGGRRQSSLDWLQMLSQLTKQPIGDDSVIGIKPLPKELGTYEYKISLDVIEAAIFIGGGAGKLTVQQMKPEPWAKPIELRVWFASAGGFIKLGTDSFSGRATSPLPWTPRDFLGRVERVKAGAELSMGLFGVGPSAGFLHVYGSEALPPLMVVDADVFDTSIGIGEGNVKINVRKVKAELAIGIHGLMGWTKEIDRLPVRDLTVVRPETLFGVSGGGQRTAHFCFDSALLTPAARQSLRVSAATWRPFLSDSRSTLSIIGHADQAGKPAYNQTLSDNRAQNVHRALRDILGSDLAVRSVEAKGMGEKEATGGGVRAGAKDRRVEVKLNGFTVLSLDSG
jgi:hypothetical protein